MKKPGAEVTREELLAFYEGKIAKWWMPDDVVFVDAIPLGATGKMQKNKLREQYGKRLLESRAERRRVRQPRRRLGGGPRLHLVGLLPALLPAARRRSCAGEVLANRVVWSLAAPASCCWPAQRRWALARRTALRQPTRAGSVRRQRAAAVGQLDDLHLGGLATATSSMRASATS